MQTKQGFTLIELLVVIAIIGLLSSISIASFGGTRAKARASAVLQTLSTVKISALGCIQGGGNLNSPFGATRICSDSSIPSTYLWPALPTSGGWMYVVGNSALGPSDTVFNFDRNKGTFTYTASGDNGIIITCTQTGCKRK